MAKILITVAYFGPLPDYFPQWLTTCRFNTTIDWLVVTDTDPSRYDWPANVHVMQMDLDGFSALMSNTIEMPVKIKHAYKVCDFKPLYWALVDSFGGQWDFWGHCDVDLMFGDISNYLTPQLLEDFDKIFSVGHFTIYRNDEISRTFYRRHHPTIDWKSILTSEAHFGFDEHIGVNLIWQYHNGRAFADESVVADIDPHICRFERSSNYFNFKNYRHQVFCFDRGKVQRLYLHNNEVHTQDFMYMHFQKRRFAPNQLLPETERFFVTPDGLVEMDDPPATKADFDRLNPAPLVPSLVEVSYRIRRQLRLIKLGLHGQIR